MTAIPLKSIEGCLVAKEALIKEYENEISVEKLSGNVVKEAMAKGIVMGLKMNQQGEVKIGLKREQTAKTLFDMNEQRILPRVTWEQCEGKHWYYKQADAILNALPELVEVQK